MYADETADKVARAMLAAEGTGPAWGIEIEEASEGYARIRMRLRADMLQFGPLDAPVRTKSRLDEMVQPVRFVDKDDNNLHPVRLVVHPPLAGG